jgi:SAM-dependent methyltransferase
VQTAERVSHRETSDNYVYQRSLVAYLETAKIISGSVLEIGTGSGYGLGIVAPKASKFVTIDKFKDPKVEQENSGLHIEFLQMNVPPFTGIQDNSFDYVISFQVIEHIKNDEAFVKEIHRVLKPGGKFIHSTPNKKTTLSRNPWHIREYTCNELENLLLQCFAKVDKNGVFGNDKVMLYYNQNKASVHKIMKYDIFNLQYLLPRWLLQIPFDVLNRMNRKKLLQQDNSLVASIAANDFFVAPANDACLDLFYFAIK